MPFLTTLGANEAIFASSRPFFILSIRPEGGTGLRSWSILSARPWRPMSAQPSASSTRR